MGEYSECKEKFEFCCDDFDGNGAVKISKLLYHLQEIASSHVARAGFGIEDIKKENYIWVLSKLKYRLYEELIRGKSYIISTCQRKKKAVTYLRDYFICDETGKMVLEGTSQWCVLNFVTRKVEKVDFGVENIDHESQYINEGFDRIRMDNGTAAGSHIIAEEDLDDNMHTNNCKYGDFISGVTGNSNYRDFSIYFSKETILGDEILFFKEANGDEVIVTGELADGTSVFQAKMK